MKTINKLSKLFTLTISCLLVLGLVACTNLFGTKIEKAYVNISASTQNLRTVLPTAFTPETTGLTWTLSGTKDNTSVTFENTWSDTNNKTAYENMTSDTFLIPETGSWTFTLIAQIDGKDVLYSKISQEIKAGPNTLSFDMTEATSDNLADGEISFELSFPSNVISKAEAYLYKYNGTDFDETSSDSQTISVTESADKIKYEKNIAAGYYRLRIELYQNVNNNDTKINTYSTLVRVAPGLCSAGSYQIENLAQLYTVTYNLDGGKMPNNFTSETHNGYTSFTLPTPTREGYDFTGWYTPENERVGENGKYTLTSDITLFAKWEAKGSQDNPITNWDDLVAVMTEVGGDIYIFGDMTANKTLTVTKVSKLIANDAVTISRGDDFTSNFFNISSGVSLEIAGSENSTITLDGGNSDTISADSPLITVNGKLTLSNCTLQNNTNSALPNAFGGAVYVDGGTLNFSSGTIQNCIAGDAGAVYLTNGGSFEMSGGTIQNCEASLSGGAVWMDNGSSFIMDGGEISNCKTTGNEGGALYITGTGCSALMKGTAKITGCQSTNKAAGGVNLGGGTFTMTDDSCISDCTANTDGNGIYINGGTFNISGDAYVNSSNDVYFSDNTSNIINISGILTKDEVAKISLCEYTVGKQILSAGDGVALAEQVGKFTLSEDEYTIAQDGKLAKKETIINLTQEVLENYSSNNDRYSLPAGEYCVTENLSLKYPIQISAAGSEVKLYSNEDCTISCSSNFSTSLASTIIQLPMSSGKLSLGGGAGTLTIDGKNQYLSYLVISQSDLELTNNCSITNGSVSYGAVYFTSGTFNMYGGTIENNTTTGSCSGIYTMGGTTNIVGGTIQNNYSNSTNNGASIYHNGGTLTILGTTISSGTHYTKNIVNGVEEEVSSGGTSGDGTIRSVSDLITYYDSTNDCYALTTGEYIFGNSFELDYPLYIFSGEEVTIKSNTDVIITSSFNNDNLIYVDLQDEDTYGTLTIGGGDGMLTLKHINNAYSTISSYGKLTLENNCEITDSQYCAIQVYNGMFYMYGGKIHDNKYTGTNTQSSAITLLFTSNSINDCCAEFYGGEIYNNETSTSGGGVAYIGEAWPYMVFSDVKIYNNKATTSGGGIYSSYEFTVITGAQIYDNYVNSTNYGASIYVEDNGNFYFGSDMPETPYNQNIK